MRSFGLRTLTAAFLWSAGVLTLTLSPNVAQAQAVLGVGDDALVLPRGVMRLRLLGQSTSFDERYGMNTPGYANGSLEPLAVDFNLDTVGITQFPNLTGLQTGLRSLTGLSTWNLSLGKTVVRLNDRITAFPVVLEAGLSNRFSMGMTIPIVKTRSEVFFSANPNGNEGNVAFNPALAQASAYNADTALVNQLNRAAASLNTRYQACVANQNSSPACPAIIANAPGLIASTQAFAGGVSQIYTASPFVPVTGSDAQLAINARVAALRAAYAQFGDNTTITSTGPIGSPNVLTTSDAQTILTNPAFGVAASQLATIERFSFGDIEVGGKFLLFDSFEGNTRQRMAPTGFNYRLALGGVIRLPTGQADRPNNFVDIGTGNGQTDLEGRIFSDILFGKHFWQSFVMRYNAQLSDKQFVRIIDLPNRQLAPFYRERKVDRNLGNIFEFETTPRWVFNNYMSLSAQYVYRHKGIDKYEGTFDVPAAVTGYSDITLNAATLNQETELTEHRLGGGFAFSNLQAFEQGKAKIPFEVTYLHFQTVKGKGGNVPKLFSDQIQLRLYARLFGR